MKDLALGIVLAGGNNERMRELSRKRAISAMPVGGNYRSIDFTLSNMTNSRIQKVAVLTQYNSRSLNEHLNSSKWWDFGRKQGGLYLFTPTITEDNAEWYRGTADSIYQNIDFLKRSHEPYVVITSGDGVYKLNYTEVVNYHKDQEADITIVCKAMPEGQDLTRFGVVKTDTDGRIMDFEEKPQVAVSNTVSCGIYVFRRRQLIEWLEECAQQGCYDLVQDIIIRYKDLKKIYAYQMKGYWNSISSVESYYQTNMDFLDKNVRDYFFKSYPDVYTKVDDNPPAKYNPGAVINNSLVSSGCILNGRVENSVLFKRVKVGKNCVIRNSIILNDVEIQDNVHIENCIVESRSEISAGSVYKAGLDNVEIVEKRKKYI